MSEAIPHSLDKGSIALLGSAEEIDSRVDDGVEVKSLWVRDGEHDRTFVQVINLREDQLFAFEVAPSKVKEAQAHPFAFRADIEAGRLVGARMLYVQGEAA